MLLKSVKIRVGHAKIGEQPGFQRFHSVGLGLFFVIIAKKMQRAVQ